jgi:penicillin amidase
LTQQLDFTTAPLDYSVLQRSLGASMTAQLFPVMPANAQHPYDPGPYSYDGVAPLAAANANAASPDATTTATAATATATTGASPAAATAAANILSQAAQLPADTTHVHPDSNAWAVNGPLAGSSASVLAGDPHLQLSLPSDWYEVSLSAPGFNVAGASLPGMPAVVLGHNNDIAWSLTDVQNQSTLFYQEKTSPAHPGEYYWQGAWRPMQRVHYSIPVRGGVTKQLTVDLTVHGPVMTEDGQTTSVDWMGDIPSPDLAALLSVDTASNWANFTSALSGWRAPTQNFVFSDNRGNIGAISAGYYPVVRSGQPWLPLSGIGQSDVAGTIPYAAVPQVYDPPSHVVATANQRPVSAAYPYYIGTSQGFDPGYRADDIYATLDSAGSATSSGSAALQNSDTDYLASQIVPQLLTALHGTALSGQAQTAAALLSSWNDSMTSSSAAASVWWTFWNDYMEAVFQPWWKTAQVPTNLDYWNLSPAADPAPLLDDLEQWTLHDPGNKMFTAPGKQGGSAVTAMRSAFTATVAHLSKQLGSDPSTWTWGKLHKREIPSLLDSAALGYGPLPAGGDPWTPDAADNGMTSDFGPSWRMITAWSDSGQAAAEISYPGGQNENPASAWYDNLVQSWWDGDYLALSTAADPQPGSVVWTLRPGK